jgi:hypothetical protein
MSQGSHPTLPRSNEPRSRRPGSSGAERPLRAQLVIAAVLVLITVAVPLYLLRRPSGVSNLPADAGAAHLGVVVRAPIDAATEGATQVRLGPIQRVRCGAARGEANFEGGQCDPLPVFEAALRESIRDTVSCAPRTGKEGSINFVLEVDFSVNRLNVFPGQSGKWRGPQARRATLCALRSFPPISWGELTHSHDYYAVAVLATYPPPDPLDSLPSFE